MGNHVRYHHHHHHHLQYVFIDFHVADDPIVKVLHRKSKFSFFVGGRRRRNEVGVAFDFRKERGIGEENT